MMGSGTKSVNVIGSHGVASMEEEAAYAYFDVEEVYVEPRGRLSHGVPRSQSRPSTS